MGLRTVSNSISQARLLIAVGTMNGRSRPARMNRLKSKRLIQHQRQPEAQQQLERHRDEAIDQGVGDGAAKDLAR